MGALRVTLWSAACVALGIALATVEVGGRTPWQRARSLTKEAPRLEAVRGEVEGAVAVARQKLGAKRSEPTETHLDSEREAVNRLVAQRTKR